jgi:uroporphyrinogen-III synthase
MGNSAGESKGLARLSGTAPVVAQALDRSLAGFTVGITADRRWEEQAELLRRRGAGVVHGPSIRTLPVGPDEELFGVTEALLLDPPDLVIANTGIGMRAWMAAADSWGLGDALLTMLKDSVVLARGPKASAAVHQSGISVASCAPSERLDELISIALQLGIDGRRVAFQRHGDESPQVTARLRAAGATVIEVPVYRWILPVDLTPARELVDAVAQRTVQAVTFTSAPAVRNFLLIAQEQDRFADVLSAFNESIVPMVVGPVCAAAALDIGINYPLMPDRYRIGPMIRTLSDKLIAEGKRTTLGGVPVGIRGTDLVIGEETISLSDREAALLGVLLEAAPRVVSRATLLDRVWAAGADPHVIDVTLGRLRRRLGGHASSVVAVPRRGVAIRP